MARLSILSGKSICLSLYVSQKAEAIPCEAEWGGHVFGIGKAGAFRKINSMMGGLKAMQTFEYCLYTFKKH